VFRRSGNEFRKQEEDLQMNRVSTVAVLLVTAGLLAGCSGFGNDPFNWFDERGWSNAGASPSQGAFPGDADMAGTADQGRMDQGTSGMSTEEGAAEQNP
jgi:hypothetical protein